MLHRLTIGQKLLLSFGVLLAVLALSLAGSLFYLSRVNSYVDRHQRITIPGVVTAAEIQRTVSQMQTQIHHVLEHQSPPEHQATLARLADMESQVTAAAAVYRASHAARTHPVLFGMLHQHGRTELADQEDRAMTDIDLGLTKLKDLRLSVAAGLSAPKADRASRTAIETAYEQQVAGVETALATLIEIHRKIDVEMKLEGDRLVREAGTIVLGLAALFGLLILGAYLTMRRLVARPLERLASTADRVTEQDLSATFEPWPSSDEVGRLSRSLTGMLANLRQRSSALVHKTKELEAFTYSVAHDLKGPLREIEGFSSLLEKRLADTADSEVTHYLDVIRRSALRLSTMIDALLKYSRLEQQTLPMTRFNLLEMVGLMVAERQLGSQGRSVKITTDLPFGDLYGEPVSVRQALHNLLDNAVKFSRQAPHPEVTIGGRRAGHETVIWIRDNGIGIDPAQHARIFGLFERLHAPDEIEGTGVGLAIVKLVMEKHGGRVWVESTPGQGSTFFLVFPEHGP